jgi:uncharacterized protein (TIGR02453 family)
MPEHRFIGFSKETWRFLAELQHNNTKSWFEANRSRYAEHVLQPLQALVSDMSPHMLRLDSRFETRPQVNKTISRIYRDIRFSKDKSPYRSRMWITFKQASDDWKERPAYFFEISPTGCRYGMGFYTATKETMDVMRSEIAKQSKAFLAAYVCLNQHKEYGLYGDDYRRQLNKDLPEKYQMWYQKKNVHIMAVGNQLSTLGKPSWTKTLSSNFADLLPIYLFFKKIKST